MTSSSLIEVKSILKLPTTPRSHDELSESTISLSDNESDLGASSHIEEFDDLSLLKKSEHANPENDQEPQQQRKKSVSFSQVRTREYNVVDELPSPLDHEDEAPRRSLGWDFIERQTDIESHLTESMRLRKEECARLIHEHILRAEKEREEKREEEKRRKKGWKARVRRALKPVGQGFMEAALRSNFAIASPY
jgi:hypothetical protein